MWNLETKNMHKNRRGSIREADGSGGGERETIEGTRNSICNIHILNVTMTPTILYNNYMLIKKKKVIL
jgi:hypothetical protein